MTLRIRLTVVLLALWMPLAESSAQTGEQGLLWRAGDPFVFCRHGMQHSPRAWYPVPDYARSSPLPTPGYCPGPTMYCGWFRGWSLEEILAYFTYLRICPQAERSGRWQGDGDGTQAPFSH